MELAHTFAEEKLKASRKEAEAAIEEANKLQTTKKEKVHKDVYLYYFKSSSVADSVRKTLDPDPIRKTGSRIPCIDIQKNPNFILIGQLYIISIFLFLRVFFSQICPTRK